ncbi:MAG: caspase family protein, partial [Bacteroidota bacterium]
MRILLLFFGLFTLNLVPASRPSQIAQPKDYALFFACNNYQKMDDLKNPIQNVRDIASILQRDYSFSTQVVENPSLTDMRKILKQYEEDFQNGRKDAKGQLLLFLTGHGKVESETGFFIPSDGDPEDLYFTSFNYDYWRKVINNFNCQHILVAVDACFSVRFDPKWKGTKNPDFSRPGERTAKDKMLMQHQSKKARFLFTSDGNEKETPDKSNFAKRFQEGLLSKGENDGILTSTELFTYLEMASPTPHCSDFGDDQVGSSFLFMYGGEIANPQSAYLKAVDCGTAPCLRKYIKDYPSSPFANAARAQLTLLEG